MYVFQSVVVQGFHQHFQQNGPVFTGGKNFLDSPSLSDNSLLLGGKTLHKKLPAQLVNLPGDQALLKPLDRVNAPVT